MSKYKAHAEYGHVYGDTLATPIGRLCWIYLVSPKPAKETKEGEKPGKPRYEVTLLLSKTDPALAPFTETIDKMYDEMLAVFNKKRLSQQGAPLGKGPLFSDGDGDWVDKEKYPFYAGNHLLRATNTQKPGIWDAVRVGLDPESINAGMIGRLVITPMATSHGLRFKLTDVQMLKDDGVRYSGFFGNTSSFLDAIGPADESSTSEEATFEDNDTSQGAVGVAAQAAVEAPPAAVLEGKKTLSPAEQAAARRQAAQSQTQNQRRASLDKL